MCSFSHKIYRNFVGWFDCIGCILFSLNNSHYFSRTTDAKHFAYCLLIFHIFVLFHWISERENFLSLECRCLKNFILATTSAYQRHMSSCPLHFHMYVSHTMSLYICTETSKLVVFNSIVNKRVKCDFHKIWACAAKPNGPTNGRQYGFYSSNSKNCTHTCTRNCLFERKRKVYWIVTQQMCIALQPNNNEFSTQHTSHFGSNEVRFEERKEKRSKMRSVFCSLVKLHSACTSKEHIGANRANTIFNFERNVNKNNNNNHHRDCDNNSSSAEPIQAHRAALTVDASIAISVWSNCNTIQLNIFFYYKTHETIKCMKFINTGSQLKQVAHRKETKI